MKIDSVGKRVLASGSIHGVDGGQETDWARLKFSPAGAAKIPKEEPMFVIFLKFSDNRAQAGEFMDGHNAWLKRGFDDGKFLLAGSLQAGQGGAVLAHGISREALEARVGEDPFVAQNVVNAEIHDIAPGMADERLRFLVD
jgi:uncharacterized protein YciI